MVANGPQGARLLAPFAPFLVAVPALTAQVEVRRGVGPREIVLAVDLEVPEGGILADAHQRLPEGLPRAHADANLAPGGPLRRCEHANGRRRRHARHPLAIQVRVKLPHVVEGYLDALHLGGARPLP